MDLASFSVRPAVATDAKDAIEQIRDSITKLCQADHRNDLPTLEAWLADKTSENLLRWLASPERSITVAVVGGEIAGTAMIRRDGEICLCYVAPGRQGLGIGRALLDTLEKQARLWGLTRIHLGSTSGARTFYEHQGYRLAGNPRPGFGITCVYPYAKTLSP